ncbi:Hypothetical_protein [Hexamita inflata]|uniref:Hypothetical_protein n=1 Tax=Hexamita inflata TaxID=28002 RepID=A0ABP1HMI7_9EUKA
MDYLKRLFSKLDKTTFILTVQRFERLHQIVSKRKINALDDLLLIFAPDPNTKEFDETLREIRTGLKSVKENEILPALMTFYFHQSEHFGVTNTMSKSFTRSTKSINNITVQQERYVENNNTEGEEGLMDLIYNNRKKEEVHVAEPVMTIGENYDDSLCLLIEDIHNLQETKKPKIHERKKKTVQVEQSDPMDSLFELKNHIEMAKMRKSRKQGDMITLTPQTRRWLDQTVLVDYEMVEDQRKEPEPYRLSEILAKEGW